MKEATKRFIEQLLKDYPLLDTEIKKRRAELLYPTKKEDENIGGGRSNLPNNPIEKIVLTLDQDMRLNALERQRKIIENVLSKLSAVEYQVIEARYFKKFGDSWEKISMATNYSRRNCFYVRDKVLKEIAEKLGLY
ncbi:DUF722 domain-containing protein [Allofustis seminis]|uniref:DUF722 domain-containing protein n=1 Tax=Allofustis seminis TaxID=166939 RepID=UPI00037350E8|nr:DUF722 domain-containing protein [Allofustis seminis]